MRRIAVVVVVLALTACGDDPYATERDQVKELIPGAEEVRCSGESPRAVDCRASLKGHAWFCEFRYDEAGGRMPAYSGVSSCWTDR